MILTIRKETKSIDIKINEKLKVSEALDVLSERNIIHLNKDEVIVSERENIVVDSNKSFEQNKIYNGDILNIKSQGGKKDGV